jgi:hypothetical protein
MGKPGRLRRVRRLVLAGLLCFVLLNLLAATFGRPRRPEAHEARSPDGRSAESWLDPVLGAAVTVITHQDNGIWGHNREQGRVRCWSREGWKKQQANWDRRYGSTLGPLSAWRSFTTGVPRREIELAPYVCGELSSLQSEPLPVWRSRRADAVAYSVGALAHEARHFSGAHDEWSTECYGVQSIRDVAVALGRTTNEGQYLASLYWKHFYLRNSLRYRALPQCHDGGEWDLRPKTSVWP